MVNSSFLHYLLKLRRCHRGETCSFPGHCHVEEREFNECRPKPLHTAGQPLSKLVPFVLSLVLLLTRRWTRSSRCTGPGCESRRRGPRFPRILLIIVKRRRAPKSGFAGTSSCWGARAALFRLCPPLPAVHVPLFNLPRPFIRLHEAQEQEAGLRNAQTSEQFSSLRDAMSYLLAYHEHHSDSLLEDSENSGALWRLSRKPTCPCYSALHRALGLIELVLFSRFREHPCALLKQRMRAWIACAPICGYEQKM